MTADLVHPDRLVVGRIVKPHGINGEVVIRVVSDAPERFAPGAVMAAGERSLTVAKSRFHQERLLVRFEGVRDREGAEALRASVLTIARDDARALPDGSFYAFELEGFDVVDTDGASLGTFLRVEENPAHDHWVVAVGRTEVLVPAVRQIVIGVDRDSRRITLDPPEGLF